MTKTTRINHTGHPHEATPAGRAWCRRSLAAPFANMLTELIEMPHDDIEATKYVIYRAQQAGQDKLVKDLTEWLAIPYDDIDTLIYIRDMCRMGCI